MKKILVCGAGGFLGTHLVNRLKSQGHYVIGADLKLPEFSATTADEFYQCDLRDQATAKDLITAEIDTIYQLAADMGGAGYVFTGEHDADIMRNSTQINLNVLNEMIKKDIKNIFYTSSACVYPAIFQVDVGASFLSEQMAYPADADSAYGWEKLLSEMLYLNFAKNYQLRVRIARLHNVFGPLGAWNNGKEKAPAALCRKIALSTGPVEIWGGGDQTRSFLYIEDCIEGILRIQEGNYSMPLNLGSDRPISISGLAQLIATISGKEIQIEKNFDSPMGVIARCSDNELIKRELNWSPPDRLEYGLKETYFWIKGLVDSMPQDKN